MRSRDICCIWIGKWSLLFRSGSTIHSNKWTKVGWQKVRSRVGKRPVAASKRVLYPVFKRTKSEVFNSWASMSPVWSEVRNPQITWCALKSANKIRVIFWKVSFVSCKISFLQCYYAKTKTRLNSIVMWIGLIRRSHYVWIDQFQYRIRN